MFTFKTDTDTGLSDIPKCIDEYRDWLDFFVMCNIKLYYLQNVSDYYDYPFLHYRNYNKDIMGGPKSDMFITSIHLVNKNTYIKYCLNYEYSRKKNEGNGVVA